MSKRTEAKVQTETTIGEFLKYGDPAMITTVRRLLKKRIEWIKQERKGRPVHWYRIKHPPKLDVPTLLNTSLSTLLESFDTAEIRKVRKLFLQCEKQL